MRLLAISDVHLNINRRMDDTVASLTQILNIISEEKVSNVLVLGDVYTSRRPHSAEREAFQTWIRNVLRIVFLNNPEIKDSIVILRGNHDESPDGSHSFTEFTALDYPGVTVLENPAIWNGYFLGHILLRDAKIGTMGYSPTEGMTAAELVAKYPGHKAYLLGDVHKAQVLQENPLVAYMGGIEHTDFAERNDEKAVYMIDTETGAKGFIGLKTRPMMQYDLYPPYVVEPTRVDGAIIKIVVHGLPEDVKAFSEQRCREALATCKELTIAYDIQSGSVARDKKVNESITPLDALTEYVSLLTLPEDERLEVLRLGKEIIDNART